MAMPAKTTSDDDDSNNLNEGTKTPHKKVIIFETPVQYHRAKVSPSGVASVQVMVRGHLADKGGDSVLTEGEAVQAWLRCECPWITQ
jgi:hypothetical protein